MVNESVVDRIRHLLNLAEHENSNQYEAACALERAQALLLEHNLTRGDVVVGEATPTPPGIGQVDRSEDNGYAWKASLVNVIARASLCHVVGTPSEKTWHLFGAYDNVKAVLEMYGWIVPELESMATREYHAYNRDGGREAARTWKTGFFYGAMASIQNRLREPLNRFAAGPGQAIMAYNAQAIQDALHRVYPDGLGHSRRQSSGGYDGLSAGRQAGHSMRLQPQRRLSGVLALN